MPKAAAKDLHTQLEAFAEKLLSDVQTQSATFSDRIEAFKIISTFYLGTTKAVAKNTGGKPDPDAFRRNMENDNN